MSHEIKTPSGNRVWGLLLADREDEIDESDILAIEAEARQQDASALDREAVARSLKARYGLRQSVPELMMGLDIALAALPPSAPPGLDAERLTEAMDFDRVEAQAIIRKHGFVFATDLSKPLDSLNDAERWEKLAFTLYSMLLPSNRRSESIAAEYARLEAGLSVTFPDPAVLA